MSDERDMLETALRHALSGHQAHVGTSSVFDGLDWTLAGDRPKNSPHSAYQLLRHMVYWQEWVLEWLDGKRPTTPRHAAGSWPDTLAAPDRQAWKREVRRFQAGLRRLDQHASDAELLRKRGRRGRSGLDMLQAIASHNSYHAGQVVVVRQMVGAWPPPSGGLTW